MAKGRQVLPTAGVVIMTILHQQYRRAIQVLMSPLSRDRRQVGGQWSGAKIVSAAEEAMIRK